MPEGLDCMKASLFPLSSHLCHGYLHTTKQAHIYTVCVYGMDANTYGMCMEYAIYVICHIYRIFKSLHTYIYTALILFFFHAVMEVFLKNE